MYKKDKYESIVTDIIDGDTIKVITKNENKPLNIRLSCIDTPEIKQPWGVEAKLFLKYTFILFKTK